MGERKVLNKYFPPDFDPALLPKRLGPGKLVVKVRVMLPFSCQCADCGNFIYRGTKCVVPAHVRVTTHTPRVVVGEGHGCVRLVVRSG